MRSDQTLRRIGIVDQTSLGWTAGSSYVRTVVHSLGNACRGNGVELFLLSPQQNTYHRKLGFANILPIPRPHYFRGEPRLRGFFGWPKRSSLADVARAHQISVLLPLSRIPHGLPHSKAIGWIPDFQHVHLPEFFPEALRRERDTAFLLMARRAARVILSSRDALQHFVSLFPNYSDKGRVASFPSPLFAFEPPQGDVSSTQRKFNLPDKIALVVNQFWHHKNHLLVVNAISQLRRKGIRIPVVMVGLPVDERDPSNQALSTVLQAMASGSVTDQITVLGLVSEADLVNLMRVAAVVLQPSRFEGWSTPVQDAKALGRPLICSDIPVHREQVPDALGFVPWDDPDALAGLLADSWSSLEPGPNLAMESRSLAEEQEFAQVFGKKLLKICQETWSI